MRMPAILALTLLCGSAAAAQAPAPAPDAETAQVNGVASSTTSAQTDTIRQSQEKYARDLAAYAEAQAAFERAKSANDAERAAAAAQAADYQKSLAAWQATVDRIAATRRAKPAKEPVVVASNDGAEKKRQSCSDELLTGSRLQKRRVCRTPGTTRDQQAANAREMDAMGRGFRPALDAAGRGH